MNKRMMLVIVVLAVGAAFYMFDRSGVNILPINIGGENAGEVEAPAGGCYIGGCSGQICSDQEGVVSTCEYSAIYACYQRAKCERQSDGKCGWTETEDLRMCLNSAE